MSVENLPANYKVTEKGKTLFDWIESHEETCEFISRTALVTLDSIITQMPIPDDMKHELLSKSHFTMKLQICIYMAEGGSENYIVSRITSTAKKLLQDELLQMLAEGFQSVDQMD
jgi:hypothetical protein